MGDEGWNEGLAQEMAAEVQRLSRKLGIDPSESVEFQVQRESGLGAAQIARPPSYFEIPSRYEIQPRRVGDHDAAFLRSLGIRWD